MRQSIDIQPNTEQLHTINQKLETQPPQEILTYAFEEYAPHIILACSFGAEDVVLADMIFRCYPGATLFYLDTDFLFPETHQVRDRIVQKYQLKSDQVIQVKSLITPDAQATTYGEALWTKHPDQCCQLRKIEPLNRVLKNYTAWITGIRRDQSPTRANTGIMEWDKSFQLIKMNPLATWTWEQVWTYIHANDVPYNVLHEQNYPSIGCTHCTSPVMPGDDPRSGRWKNFAKTECGLHPSKTSNGKR
ncbi:phosphoadenylyl-sulfate reductase [Candidatus Nitrospira salsa]